MVDYSSAKQRLCLDASGGEAMLKDLVEYLAKALVDNPEEVKVTEVEGESATVLELSVAKTDLGKVIGRQGKTARAMRTILGASSAKLGKKSILEIVE
jgi:predicted RNA-binding protein YlqC (UPF0109 family)